MLLGIARAGRSGTSVPSRARAGPTSVDLDSLWS